MENVLIYSTEASRYFAELIARGLGLEVGEIERKKFGGIENYYRIGIDDRSDLIGKTAIFVGSTHTDENLLEIYDVSCALVGYGLARLILPIPFFGYSTMERAKKPGEVVTAKTRARILSTIPNGDLRNILLLLDLHVSGMLNYFEGNCLRFELYAEKVLREKIQECLNEKFSGEKLNDCVFASADLGRPKWVKTFAKYFKTGLALVDKDREGEKTKTGKVMGKVKNKIVIIYDDMNRGSGTLVDAAHEYLNCGAMKVYAVLSHLACNDKDAIKKLEESPIEKIITTNSHPMSQHPMVQKSDKFIIADVSGEFVKIIQKILH